jgi:putative endopeptidase
MTTKLSGECPQQSCSNCTTAFTAAPPLIKIINEVFLSFCSWECFHEWDSSKLVTVNNSLTPPDDTTDKTDDIGLDTLAGTPPPFDFKGMDLSVDPGEDFYRYAVGTWLKENPLPKGHTTWSAFNKIEKSNNSRLQVLLEAPADATESHDTRLAKAMYSSAMDVRTRNQSGLAPVQAELDRIKQIESVGDLCETIGHLHTIGVGAYFPQGTAPHPTENQRNILFFGQGGVNLPDHEILLTEKDTDANKNHGKRAAYRRYIQEMFLLNGDNKGAARANGISVLDIETKLARAHLTREASRDRDVTTNLTTINELRLKYPTLEWSRYLKGLDVEPDDVNVMNVAFFDTVAPLLDSETLTESKAYLTYCVMTEYAPYLTTRFESIHWDFYSKSLTGATCMRPRAERATIKAGGLVGDAVGRLFVKYCFPPKMKAKVEGMVEVIKECLIERIGDLAWLTDATKEKAVEKVNKTRVKIGYPEEGHWTDYSNLTSIASDRSFASNALDAQQHTIRRHLDSVGKPVDNEEWPWPPQMVNACNRSNRNEIIFPAGIIQHPFYTNLEPLNWGAFGGVIAHEIIHSFDDQGRKFDATGSKKDWWTPEDTVAYQKHADVIIEQFSSYSLKFSDGTEQSVNGKLTLGENIADLGGLNIAYAALEKSLESKEGISLEGFTPQQLFFLGWAQAWRFNASEKSQQLRLDTDPHSPPAWRVNGPLSQMKPFQEAFELDDEAPLVDQTSKMWS